VSRSDPVLTMASLGMFSYGIYSAPLPQLDSLLLALPVSWKGTLIQYTGRLHRLHPGKTEARIVELRGPRRTNPAEDVREAPAGLPGDRLRPRCGASQAADMRRTMARAERPAPKKKSRTKSPSNARLDEMIEEAIVDAYGESEQMTGFYTMLDDNLAVPFRTEMLGVEVTVERVDMTDDEQIVAVCARGKSRQRVPILDLPLLDPPPEGAEWIDAFRRWARGR
jgi:hypothetical protein